MLFPSVSACAQRSRLGPSAPAATVTSVQGTRSRHCSVGRPGAAPPCACLASRGREVLLVEQGWDWGGIKPRVRGAAPREAACSAGGEICLGLRCSGSAGSEQGFVPGRANGLGCSSSQRGRD